jgi:DNA-binding SARP family transcriptional activator
MADCEGGPAGPARVAPIRPNNAQPILAVDLLGPMAIRVGGRRVETLPRKARALCAYLSLRAEHSESRERLASLLWSESDGDKARASLRQAIAHLREQLAPAPPDAFISTRLDFGFAAWAVRTDLESVLTAAEQGRAHPLLHARESPVESMLADLEDIDPEFRIWLLAKRRTLGDRLVHLLERRVGEAAPDQAAAVANARAIMGIDGTHEVAARVLMRHHAIAGEEARALKIYGDLWSLLERQFDCEPSKETQDLAVAIKLGKFGGAAPDARDAPSRIVAPPAQQAPVRLFIGRLDRHLLLSEPGGLTVAWRQELIGNLVRFREWHVFDESVAPFDAKPPGESAQSFRLSLAPFDIAGESAVSILLKDAVTAQVLWSETLAFGSRGWTEGTVRTIRRLATTLNVYVSSARLRRLDAEQQAPAGLQDRWLRAYSALMTYQSSRWDEVLEMLRGVVAAAPNFSPGFRSLAQWENARHIARPGVRRSMERHLRTIDVARRAVELDPVDSRAHLCLAWSHILIAEKEQARAHAEIAIELNAADPWTLVSGGNILGFCGEVERALAAADAALAASPLHSPAHLSYDGHIRFMAGDYERCLGAMAPAQPGYPGSNAWRIAALARLGRSDEAAATLTTTLSDLAGQWAGPEPYRQEPAFAWLADQFPILDGEIDQRFRGGLAAALGRAQQQGYWQTESV